MATAADMWASLVADKNQRDFSHAVMLRRQLYQYLHHRGESMLEYLEKMASLRHQLQNMGTEHDITDYEMARLLFMGVAITHRELIEQFALPTRQGKPTDTPTGHECAAVTRRSRQDGGTNYWYYCRR